MRKFANTVRWTILVLALSILTASCQVTGLFGILSGEEREFTAYILQHSAPITSVDDVTAFDDLKPLEEPANRNRVLMYGESHGIAENYDLGLRLLQYLHTLGYRYLVLETDWAYTDLLNEYLKAGDAGLLESMDSWTYPNASNNQDNFDYYKRLYEWNQSLPENKRITIWGTDIAHGFSFTKNKVLEHLATLPDSALADELTSALKEATEPRSYEKLKSFEVVFLEKTDPVKGLIDDFDKLALYVRVLKDTVAWSTIDKDPSIANDYPGVEEIREAASLAIWKYMLSQLDPEDEGKMLFHGGSWHTVKAVKSGSEQRLGILLNEAVPELAGKVFTLCAIPVSGTARKADGGTANVQTYSGLASVKAKLRKLPSRWSLAMNNDDVYYPGGALYDAFIILKDCTAAKDRS